MQRLVIVGFVLSLFVAGKNFAQSFDNFKDVDALTYRLYTEEKWDSLIVVSKKIFNNDIDYYYLRMRVGIAFYEHRMYRDASTHFEKALGFNAADDIALEYLYYSYLFSGQNESAIALSRRFSNSLSEKLNVGKNKLLEEIYIEGGPTLGNNPYGKNNQQNHSANVLLREEELTNDVRYYSLALKHQLTKNINVFHAVSSIDIGKTQIFDVYNGMVSNDYRIYQRQYYINAGIYLGKGVVVTPAFHIIDVNFDKLFYSFDKSNNKLFLEQINHKSKEQVYSLSVKKNYGRFDVGLNYSYAYLNNDTHIQYGATASYFPLGNLDYYFIIPFNYQRSKQEDNLIIDPMLGVKLHKSIWAEINYTYGNLNNFVEKNGYIVYNINDKILSRKGLALKINAHKHIQFSLIYNYLKKENFRTLLNNNHESRIITTKDFINHTIIGGIKWTL